jgi:hypothetical protein
VPKGKGLMLASPGMTSALLSSMKIIMPCLWNAALLGTVLITPSAIFIKTNNTLMIMSGILSSRTTINQYAGLAS